MHWFYSSLKNRFYISILALVVLSLVVTGATTFYFFKDQNDQYHFQRIQRKEKTVNSSLQYFLNDLEPSLMSEFITKDFDYKLREIADVNNLPIVIYNLSGKILISTIDTLFQERYSSDLSKDLLLKLDQSKNGRFVEKSSDQDINSYSFAFNKKHQKMGVINIPYHPSNYSNKTELWDFLNRLLTIFLLLFIGAVVLAYLLSTYITKSIASISSKIKGVEIGENNERLSWENNDEIGVLVNAYNEMLNKLELSKEKLAQTQRQIAWREMAKQVAHEIKNPLTPMKLSVQHLGRALNISKEENHVILKDFQEKMLQQIHLLTEIADEFSNYAELPKGKMKEVDLTEIINKIINLFKHESHVTFNLNFQNNSSFRVIGDENQLIRLFNNLIQNSLQAMDHRGDITLNLSQKENNVILSFIDSGPGILKDIQEKIFEPKFTTKTTGKGLGLALACQIILNHGGKITLVKDRSKGAEFKITFKKL
jgi:nitrogen fixation/metabolism regulation signal transduction histidine kinase|tara:strand:+ start:191 stop:1636 length:1446 start_codon:yes stop_codon:yes gene_type:complete